jgi:hypothetical protein
MKPHTKSRNSRRHRSRIAGLLRIHQFLRAVHGSLIADLGRPFSHHSSLITRHCLIENTTHTFLINVAAIRNVRNFKKTNNGGHF